MLSKWDIGQIKVEDVRPRLEHRLRQRPGVVTVSAKTGRGVARLLDRIEELFAKHTMRISTPELNNFLQELRAARQPPSRDRRRLNLLYGTQTRTRPPRFRFFVNDPSLVTRDYGYWVENQVRERFEPRRRTGLDRLREKVLGVRAVVVGGGSWGTAFARLLADREHEVTLVCRDPAQAAAIAETGRNPRYLTDVDLSGVAAAYEAPDGADVYVLAVPSRAFAEVSAGLPSGGAALSLTKGLDPATGERLSTLVRDRPVAVLSGPNMAEEIAQGLPSAAVIASEDEELAGELQHAINSTVFRVYVNPDLAGVELCAAAKNVIALAAGGVDGLGLGDNAQGGADHPRPGGDGAPGRGLRRPARDLRRPRRNGRPDRDVLQPPTAATATPAS